MQKVKKEIFVSEDGKEFITKSECLKYEIDIENYKKWVSGLSFYELTHDFDSTEGRGYHNKTVFIVEGGFKVFLQHLVKEYGAPIRRWYSDLIYEAYYFMQIKDKSLDEVIALHGKTCASVGTTKSKVRVVFLSLDEKEEKQTQIPVEHIKVEV